MREIQGRLNGGSERNFERGREHCMRRVEGTLNGKSAGNI